MKKIISGILALGIGISMLPSAMAAQFSDLPESHWAYSSAQELVEKGYVNGYEDGTFQPDGQVTRGEFVKMAGTESASETPVYNDVDWTFWGFKYVQGSGLAADQNGNFRPHEAITRGDAAEVMWIKAGMPSGLKAPAEIIAQGGNENAVAWVYASGIMKGGGDSDLRLEETITRAEAAAVINRGRRIIRAYGNGAVRGEIKNASYSISYENITEKEITKEDGTKSVSVSYNPVSENTEISSDIENYPESWESYPYILGGIQKDVYDAEYVDIPQEAYKFVNESPDREKITLYDASYMNKVASSFSDLYLDVIGGYVRRVKEESNIDIKITYYPSMVWDVVGNYYVFRVKCEILNTNGQKLTYKDVFQEENDTVLTAGMTFWTDMVTDYAFGIGIGSMFGFGDAIFIEK